MADREEIFSIKQRFGIIGNSPVLNHAVEVAAQVAPTDMTVLISGENGSGKESFSKIIHQISARRHGEFIAVNCGAIPEGTINSELFGHEKESFTGAGGKARKGYFEITDGGTIFLDEIGEMPFETQKLLLRVLENGEFFRVGSSKVMKTDVRVVAATNINLPEAVESGRFREDLYYRLNTVPIFVPPLRDRGDDIELLFRKFASDFAEKYRLKPIRLDDQAINMLSKYRFPGNIRQLKNIAEQISILEMHRLISAETLAKYLPDIRQNLLPAIFRQSETSGGFSERDILYKVLFDMKKDMNDLKKLVLSLLDKGVDDRDAIREHRHLFRDMDENKSGDMPSLLLSPSDFSDRNKPAEDFDKVEDVTEGESREPESLSLEEKEKEMIIKALRKNNNKRKYAAADLGISERTLYRKIRLYDIEDIR